MVSLSEVKASNHTLNTTKSSLTAVFLGCTNGIGLATLKSFTTNTTSPTIYIVGRNPSNLQTLISDLLKLNPHATLHPIQTIDLTLTSSAQTSAQAILTTNPTKIDLLIMSPGFINNHRQESAEGLDTAQAIHFYTRMRFMLTLLPLVRKAPSPRVVTILGGGQEGPIYPDDWLLQKPGNYGMMSAGCQACSLTTCFLQALASRPENKHVSFCHVYPGFVDTQILVHGLGFGMRLFLAWIYRPLVYVFGYTTAEAGERVLFAGTADRFRRCSETSEQSGSRLEKGSDGVVGSGVYLVQPDSSVVSDTKILRRFRKENMAERVYEHTMAELRRIDENTGK